MTKLMCQKVGCEEQAQFAPKVCVPTIGRSTKDSPLQAVIGLVVCKRHIKDLKAVDFLLPKPGQENVLRRLFAMQAQSYRQSPPDFFRAFIEPVSIDSSEYQTFQRMSGALPPKPPKATHEPPSRVQ